MLDDSRRHESGARVAGATAAGPPRSRAARPYDRRVRFVKGHATGNDFVLLPDPDGELDLSADLVRALCDRRRGLGADGVLRVVLSAAVPDTAPHTGAGTPPRWFMDYRNADG